ncbi:TlpA family protein disulfide reductase [Rhabdothermincola salaria]|uniref:TlpA family protein disulfide reductase n=1 Tax=Rhabdothermincola salaria TaxID=2903142 RepID=UPI001E49AE2A|nr:hypothetical protein [Rhabdothermincola salaria]MCD9623333.1 hypothetical protein [Rhabdothermincola salaria]
MERLVIAAIVVVVAVVVALVLQRRQADPPTRAAFQVPAQLDRRDFDRPDAPWLVAVFTSATCDTCAGVWDKARHLDAGPGGPVVVQGLEVGAEAELHERYGIDAVPLVVIADADGVVVRHFLGPVTATDLWAAVAEARAPGSTPGECQAHETAADENPRPESP